MKKYFTFTVFGFYKKNLKEKILLPISEKNHPITYDKNTPIMVKSPFYTNHCTVNENVLLIPYVYCLS